MIYSIIYILILNLNFICMLLNFPLFLHEVLLALVLEVVESHLLDAFCVLEIVGKSLLDI